MFGIGPSEMMVLAVIGLLLFGSRLPEVARSLGRAMADFKRGMTGVQDEFRDAYRTDSHSHSASVSHSRPTPRDERDEVTVPKFQPPTTEPTA